MTAPVGSLPDDATVILHVAKGKQLPKGASVCEAIDQDAFRCDDDGVSVNWVQHFKGAPEDQFRQAALAFKGALSIKKSGVIVAAKVGDIRETLANIGVEVDVVEDPQPGNRAHCLITGIKPDNLSALLMLALAFPRSSFVQCDKIPGMV